jgi:effector-binding domain-containing protein
VPALGIRATVDRADLSVWWQGALGELHATVRAQRAQAAGPSGGLYASEIFTDDRGEAMVFIPTAGNVRPAGRAEFLTVPAAELAVVTHPGPMSDVDVVYGDLGSYAMRHELSVDGPLREYYLRGAHDTADENDWLTEIGWPIFRADPAESSEV